MVDASVMRNLASPEGLLQFARAEGVRPGVVKVVPVWQGHFALVLPTDESVFKSELDAVVSRPRCESVLTVCYLGREECLTVPKIEILKSSTA